MASRRPQDRISARLAREQGGFCGQGRRAVALVYPSPYAVGMASLGFQTIYRLLNLLPDTRAERAFLPAPGDPGLITYEGRRPISDFEVIAFSMAYELELTGVLQSLSVSGVPVWREQRGAEHPLVVVGGPITFADPRPLGPFADVVVMGEAEPSLAPWLEAAFGQSSRPATLAALASSPGFWVPALHGDELPPLCRAADDDLPAAAAIWTPEAALPSMFLVEAERGCARACTFCVMRRNTHPGMRVVPVEKILAAIPAGAPRVGLVGAGVSDHPRLTELVRALVDSGREVGLSSLRADRVSGELFDLLCRGGLNTLTVALDAASERLRAAVDKRIHPHDLLRCADLVRESKVGRLKVYVMIGVPGERDEDLDELVAFARALAERVGRGKEVSLGISPFVPKRNTPLSGAGFAGIPAVERALARLRQGLGRRVRVRPTSSRWAWVEAALAQGGIAAGLAAHQAWQAGGSFAAWKRALAPLAATFSRGTKGDE